MDTRVALLEQSETRDAKDFEEYKVQNAKEHGEFKDLVEGGFASQTAAYGELCDKIDGKMKGQDKKIENQGKRITTVENKQKTFGMKAKLIWGVVVFVGTAVGGGIIKWGIPLLLAL
tara:strand:- start:874 stop:1224 length:351 start_codon:yes stop_codon:yes gene_type:complete